MKWSFIGLGALGLVSATCVAILVAALTGRGESRAAGMEVDFIEAAGPIEHGSVVTGDQIVARKVPRGHEPANAFRNPAQVIGKMLIVSMLKGQAFTKACFPAEGEGLELASRLPEGMRAVSLSISDSFGLRGLLYPGSTVDILVSFRSQEDGEAVSKILLEEVQVLAVDSRTVFSKEKDGKQPRSEKSKKMMVTILVDLEQAQQLQLAVRYGTLSLALRNPRDTAVLSQKPTRLGALLGRKKVALRPTIIRKTPTSQNKSKMVAMPKGPRWQVTVIHGQETQEVGFSLSK